MSRRALQRLLLSVMAVPTSLACGEPSTEAPACPDGNSECKELASVESGEQAVKKRNCVSCHGANMAGTTTPLAGVASTPLGLAVELYPPNLTADDDTGVGTWSDDALALAIRSGVDETTAHLCPQMVHFAEMSDFEVYSIVKYLRAIPAVARKVPRSVCPPLKTKEQQSLER